jgi:integrase
MQMLSRSETDHLIADKLWVRVSHLTKQITGRFQTHKTPRFGGMLVRDYLYPAAEHAGIIFRQQDGTYVDSSGRTVTRFGFHNLRKAVSDYLTEGKKADVRTIQDTLRHENPEMTLSKYTESSLESRLAAQDVMASAILDDAKRVQ